MEFSYSPGDLRKNQLVQIFSPVDNRFGIGMSGKGQKGGEGLTQQLSSGRVWVGLSVTSLVLQT